MKRTFASRTFAAFSFRSRTLAGSGAPVITGDQIVVGLTGGSVVQA
jgi:hypothetical protein